MQHDFLRYSCQISLPGFNLAAQQKLQAARVLIIGMGGLGCPAAQYLAAAGIGNLDLLDYDTISVSNLHRQVLYSPQEAGLKKCDIAAIKLKAQNPGIKINAIDVRITSDNVLNLVGQYDIIVDGTDNFDARYLINDACVLTGKPVVYGAIYQYEGQVSLWNAINSSRERMPNYRDLFPEVNSTQIPDCIVGGVIPTLAGIIGCMQANEVIKYVTGTGDTLAGKLLIFNALTMETRIIKLGNKTRTNIISLTPSVNIPAITIEELQKTGAKENYQLVDVRSSEEHFTFNIGGLNIPLKDIDMNFVIDQERPVVFYCASGKRSEQAATQIKKKYPDTKVFSLAGGIKSLMEKQ